MLSLAGLEAAFLLLFRRVNLDEGWYLWASKLVYEGKVPYRDFPFPQSPLLPYVYGLVQRLLGQGLYQGRLTSILLAMTTLVVGAQLARRRGGPGAAPVFLLLEASTLYAAAFSFAYIAPYALTGLLLLLACYFAFVRPPDWRRDALATACVMLAVGTRLSAAAVMVPLAAYLVYTSPNRRQAALTVFVSTMVCLGVVFGPFLGTGKHLMAYDVLGFHTDRVPLEWQLISVRRSLLRSVRDFAVPVLLSAAGAAAAVVGVWHARDRRKAVRAHLPELTIGLSVASLGIAHLLPRTTDSYYNALQMPLLNVLNALLLMWAWGRAQTRGMSRRAGWMWLGGLLVVNVATQAVTTAQASLIAVPLQNQVEVVREASQFIKGSAPPGSLLVTFDTPLAVESGLDVPAGFEMSYFGYRPTWSTERAREYRVINNELLLEALRGRAGAAAFTEYDLNLLYGERDQILAALHDGYRWANTVPGFGPFGEDLRIYVRPQHAAPKVMHPLDARLGDGIAFLGYDLAAGTHRRDEPLRLALYWRAQTPPHESHTVFVHLLDRDGRLVSGWDNPPCHGTCPTSSWESDEVIRDEYALPLDGSLPPGEYTMETGMYDPETGVRLDILSDTGVKVGDRIVLGSVTLE